MAERKNSRYAWIALAGLATASLTAPALARPDNFEHRGNGEPRSGNAERAAERGAERGNWQQPQQVRQEARQEAPRQAPQARQPAAWNGNRGENRDNTPRGTDTGGAPGWQQRGGGDRGSGDRGAGDYGRTAPSQPVTESRWNGGNRDGDRNDRNQAGRQYDNRSQYQGRGDDRNRDRDRDQRNWRDGGSRQTWNGHDNDRRWSRDWRQDHRYDWRNYRNAHRSVYRMRPYYAPYRGYYYQRLSIGFYLDSLFFGQDYWIGDPGYYRLPPVYGPYRWVRYYDDALLVNIYTGEVVDAIYGFFW